MTINLRLVDRLTDPASRAGAMLHLLVEMRRSYAERQLRLELGRRTLPW